MAYNEIPDSEINIESPCTEYVKKRLRDNPLAMASGESGPFYSNNSFKFVAGEIPIVGITEYKNIIDPAVTKLFGFACAVTGILRIKFSMLVLFGSGTIQGQIYINGAPVGQLRSTNSGTPIEYVEDISIDSAGVSIELYGYATDVEALVGEFGLYGEASWQFINEFVAGSP